MHSFVPFGLLISFLCWLLIFPVHLEPRCVLIDSDANHSVISSALVHKWILLLVSLWDPKPLYLASKKFNDLSKWSGTKTIQFSNFSNSRKLNYMPFSRTPEKQGTPFFARNSLFPWNMWIDWTHGMIIQSSQHMANYFEPTEASHRQPVTHILEFSWVRDNTPSYTKYKLFKVAPQSASHFIGSHWPIFSNWLQLLNSMFSNTFPEIRTIILQGSVCGCLPKHYM